MNYRFILLFLFFFSSLCNAQDISGLWVHDGVETNTNDLTAAVYAIMFLNVDDSGNVTGYTYDYDAVGSCSFYLKGNYDAEKQRLRVSNTKKITKDLFHARARFTLFYEARDDGEFLVGRARQKGAHGLLFSLGGVLNAQLNYRKVKPENVEETEGYDVLKPYIDSLNVKLDATPKEVITLRENPPKEVEETIEIEEAQVTEKPDEIETITIEKENRENELIKSHKVTSKTITIEVIDNNREDGDRITIFVNDTLIEYNLEVTKTPKVIEVALPDDKSRHKVVFVANNMGEIPPNTAKIRYTVDGVSYEEILFTNLRMNKYLEFINN